MTRSRLDSKVLGNFWNLTKSGKKYTFHKNAYTSDILCISGDICGLPMIKDLSFGLNEENKYCQARGPSLGTTHQISVTLAAHSCGEDHGNELTSTKLELLTSFFWLKCLLQNTVDAYLCSSKSKLEVFFFFLNADSCQTSSAGQN